MTVLVLYEDIPTEFYILIAWPMYKECLDLVENTHVDNAVYFAVYIAKPRVVCQSGIVDGDGGVGVGSEVCRQKDIAISILLFAGISVDEDESAGHSE